MRSKPVCMKLIPIMGLIVLLMMTSCRREFGTLDKDEPKYPCKILGACDATIIRLMENLNKKGIKVVSIGQDYLISIPARYLFEPETPHLKWKSYALLNEIATLLKQFFKITINIASYSNKYSSPQREHALTIARSRVVSEYLWSQGVDSRFIFTQGLGSDKPIMRYTQGGDSSVNARVEITFRQAVA